MGLFWREPWLQWQGELLFFLFFSHEAQLVGSQFLDQGLNLYLLHWRLRLLTTEPPGSPGRIIFEWVVLLRIGEEELKKQEVLNKKLIFFIFGCARASLLRGLFSSCHEWRLFFLPVHRGFPAGSAGKECACVAGDLGSIPGLGRSPGEGNGYPLQYSGLENSMDCIIHGAAKNRTRLSDFHFHSLEGSRLQ